MCACDSFLFFFSFRTFLRSSFAKKAPGFFILIAKGGSFGFCFLGQSMCFGKFNVLGAGPSGFFRGSWKNWAALVLPPWVEKIYTYIKDIYLPPFGEHVTY